MTDDVSTNDRFEAWSRSASFALTLSSPQIAKVLFMHKERDLIARFPWFETGRPANNFCTDANEVAAQLTDSTVRALVRRGLVNVTPKERPAFNHDVVTLTRAGELIAMLLIEAGFTAPPAGLMVNLHPDDRAPSRWVDGDIEVGPWPHDRRLDTMLPDDVPYMAAPRPESPRPRIASARPAGRPWTADEFDARFVATDPIV